MRKSDDGKGRRNAKESASIPIEVGGATSSLQWNFCAQGSVEEIVCWVENEAQGFFIEANADAYFSAYPDG